jgi:hypothetical protein
VWPVNTRASGRAGAGQVRASSGSLEITVMLLASALNANCQMGPEWLRKTVGRSTLSARQMHTVRSPSPEASQRPSPL